MFGINFIDHNDKNNCEEDCDKFIIDLNNASVDKFQQEFEKVKEPHENYLKLPDSRDFRQLDLLSKNVLSYVCGYLFRKCLNMHSCPTCTRESKATENVSSNTIMCHFKAYKTNLISTFGNLLMLGEEFVNFVRKMEIFEENIENLCLLSYVGESLLSLFHTVDYIPPCDQFPKEYVMKLFCRMRIYHSLKYSNANLKGVPQKHRKIIHLLNL